VLGRRWAFRLLPLPGASHLAPGKVFFIFFLNFFAGCRLAWHPAKIFFIFLKISLPGAA
jgi:hypothetical protein